MKFFVGQKIIVDKSYLLWNESKHFSQREEIANGVPQAIKSISQGEHEVRICHSGNDLSNGWWIPDKFIVTYRKPIIVVQKRK